MLSKLTFSFEDAKLYITEVMWGTDAALPPTGQTTPLPPSVQWIDIYNEGADLADAGVVRLVFTKNQRVENPTVDLDDNAAINDVTYTVHDRVSVINRFGARWAPKGRSAVGDNGEPVANLVSMYRKRSMDDPKEGYTYNADGTPAGDKFGGGRDGGQ